MPTKVDSKADDLGPTWLDEFYDRNPFVEVAPGLRFTESERVNFDPVNRRVVKHGTPGSIPMGEVVLFIPAKPGVAACVAVFTSEKFYRSFTLKEKEKAQ